MKLSSLVEKCKIPNQDVSKKNMYNQDITFVTLKSEDIRQGGLFIAVKGLDADGHDYIEEAFEKGAAAVIAQENRKNRKNVILVENSRQTMASVASCFYDNPSRGITLVGVTGTNGKTTTTWILESIFRSCGFSTGVIGTVNISYNGQCFDNPFTTPGSIDLQKTLYEMKKAGVTHVVMEVSSHGIDLNRIDCCEFDAGIFTNLSHDHLDYHKNMDEYFKCKRRFFTRFLENSVAIINADDEKGRELLNSVPGRTVAVSTRKNSDIYSENISDDISGLSGSISLSNETIRLKSELTGRFNLENILCAAGAAHALGINGKNIEKGIENCKSIPGRLEKIENTIQRYIFVDYAHTPDALESVLVTLKKRAPEKLITIFGCGGDRDSSKRPLMGEIACRYSDTVIITSDNPRRENPDSIIDDILAGIKDSGLCEQGLKKTPEKNFIVEIDRKKAIEKAVSISKPHDTIIAAGKGHENYQITAQGTFHLSDREELSKACARFEPIEWTVRDISAALGKGPDISNLKDDFVFRRICTDSRIAGKDDFFVCIKGDTFDSHDFVADLAGRGIKGFAVSKEYFSGPSRDALGNIDQNELVLFKTDNTLSSLGKLARYQRIRSNVKLVAITGSNGKTTTRKIIEEIFKTKFNVLATRKNFNNEIGLPMTLLNLSENHEWAIVEMGMNHPGEISRLSEIAIPDIGVVTNTSNAHLESLGSAENVARAKAEIFENVKKGGAAVIFADDPRRKLLQSKAEEKIKDVVLFGSSQKADIRSESVNSSVLSTEFTVCFQGKKTRYKINSPALFMVNNVLAAFAAAVKAGITAREIEEGLVSFVPVQGRMNIYSPAPGIKIIDDTYNANPESVSQALSTLKTISGDSRAIAVIGDMLELGDESDALHRQIGEKAAGLGISRLYLSGTHVRHTAEGALKAGFPETKIFHGTKRQIALRLMENRKSGVCVLVKGSRGMKMEKVILEMGNLLKAEKTEDN